MKVSHRLFPGLCVAKGLTEPLTEVRFHPERKWRWDFAWPEKKLAVECNGGIWVKGAHGRGTGITRDYEKWSAAAALGWRIIHVTPSQLNSPKTFDLIKEALGA